jgi:hypothetical protein
MFAIRRASYELKVMGYELSEQRNGHICPIVLPDPERSVATKAQSMLRKPET